MKALAAFFGGTLLAAGILIGAKLALVHAMGEELYRIPELQLERFREIFRERPVTHSPLLILGDSTASFSVDALLFPDALSLAVVNSTPVEAYFTAKRVLDSGARPRCVVASFSFERELYAKYFWTMFVSGGFYDGAAQAEIEEVSRNNGELPGAYSAPEITIRRLAATHGVLDGYDISRIQNGLAAIAWDRENVRILRGTIRRHKGSTPLVDASRFDGPRELFYSKPPAMSRTETEYFRRFLSLLATNGIRLYLFEVPFAATVAAPAQTAYWRDLEALVAAALPPGVPAPTYVRAAQVEPELVISAGHLTEAGVQRASPELLSATASCSR